MLYELLKHLVTYIPQSRIHPLNAFEQNDIFVKREDELGFGVSGYKLRKYVSLFIFLKEQMIKNVLLLGTPYSNHILSFPQLLIENKMTPYLFLKKDREIIEKKGNFLLTSLFVPSQQMTWIESNQWQNAHELAKNFATRFLQDSFFIIPEGAFTPEALPGALTLALDICRNERELGEEFSHIFMDAGTGLTAIATIIAFSYLQKKTHIHVICLADTEDLFALRLDQYLKIFNQIFTTNISLNDAQQQYSFHPSKTALSFGSTNATLFKEILHIARTEGFLTDPIYSAKLFLTARHLIKTSFFKGKCLLIHSGGGLTLMGFQDALKKAMK